MENSKAEKKRIQNVIIETVKLLCTSTLQYDLEMKIVGVIGVTLDNEEFCIIHVNECITTELAKTAMKNSRTDDISELKSELQTRRKCVVDEGVESDVIASKKNCSSNCENISDKSDDLSVPSKTDHQLILSYSSDASHSNSPAQKSATCSASKAVQPAKIASHSSYTPVGSIRNSYQGFDCRNDAAKYSSDEHTSASYSDALCYNDNSNTLHASGQGVEEAMLSIEEKVKLEPMDSEIFCQEFDSEVNQRCFIEEFDSPADVQSVRKRKVSVCRDVDICEAGNVVNSSMDGITGNIYQDAYSEDSRRNKMKSAQNIASSWTNSQASYSAQYSGCNFSHDLSSNDTEAAYNAVYSSSEVTGETEEEKFIRFKREQNRLRVRRCRLKAKLAAQGIIVPDSRGRVYTAGLESYPGNICKINSHEQT